MRLRLPRQDRRHHRPRQLGRGHHRRAPRGRRRRLPAELQPRHARGSSRAIRHHPRARTDHRPADRHSADLQGPKLRVGQVPGGPRELAHGDRVRFALEAEGDTVPLPTPRSSPPSPRRRAADRRRQAPPRHRGGERRRRRRPVETGGKLLDRKGVSIVGAVLPVSALTDKDRARSRLRARARRRLGGALLRPAPRGHRRGPCSRRGRADHGQAREALGHRPPRRHHRAVGRRHGRPRRSRRRDARRAGPTIQRSRAPHGPPASSAGRDADARA